ncbi:MAG: hypothetical protein D3908_04460 [Candidatus Electrothrix sp. AUS4]|nr:hypothetical protein [Candidatus Electrothrix sp. AUS4]
MLQEEHPQPWSFLYFYEGFLQLIQLISFFFPVINSTITGMDRWRKYKKPRNAQHIAGFLTTDSINPYC